MRFALIATAFVAASAIKVAESRNLTEDAANSKEAFRAYQEAMMAISEKTHVYMEKAQNATASEN